MSYDPSNPYSTPQAPGFSAPIEPAVRSDAKMPCPRCRENNATKVGWTFWGGALGPWLFNHVKCNNCRTTYNGKTGQSNTTAIVIYTVVGLVLGLVIGIFAAMN